MSVVALVPIVVFGILGLDQSNQTLRSRIEHEQNQLAHQAADLAAFKIRSVLKSLSHNTNYLDLEAADEKLLDGMLNIAYRQSDEITIVSFVNESGVAIVGSFFLENPEATESLNKHPRATAQDLDQHGRHVPLDAALTTGAAVGPPYRNDRGPRVALAVEVPQQWKGQRIVLAAEISLEKISRSVRDLGRKNVEVILVGPQGQAFLDDSINLDFLSKNKSIPNRDSSGETFAEGKNWLYSYTPVPMFGWGVVVRQQEDQALAPITKLRGQIIYWGLVGVVVAFFLAALVARDFSRRIKDLSDHAQNLAKGKLDKRIEAHSSDELGDLARAFNKTAGDLDEQRAQIEEKNREIRAWNEELEGRVEEKTNQLAQAQEIVLRSRRLAGLGVLGAGIAHEINNPLATNLGFIQLLLRDQSVSEKHRSLLQESEKSSLRIREIVQELLKLTDDESKPEYGQVDINKACGRAAHMIEGRLSEGDIKLGLDLAENLPLFAGNFEQITEAILHLLQNARQAVRNKGTITIRTEKISGQLIRLSVEDNGKGIPDDMIDRVFDPFFTTKESWESRGLGLSIVHKITEEHSGKLDIESEVGRGTKVMMTFAVSMGKRHLE